MRFLGVVGAAVLAVACGGGSKPKPGTTASGPEPTCVAVADKVKKLARKADETVDRLREVFVERCERDGWSAEFKSCVMATETLDKPKRCKELLGGLQREALDRGIQDAEFGSETSACHEYVRVVKKLKNCPGYTKEMVDQSVQSAEYYLEEYMRADNEETRKYTLQSCEDMLRSFQYTISSCNGP
jgi:hypothetical protein